MSATSAPATESAPEREPTPTRRGMGSVRSMVISMVLILAAVLAWVAMVPRVRGISQPAVDVGSVARQVRQETSWAISVPQLPVGWKATSVRFTAAGDGLRTWHVGYLSPEGNYVSIDQTSAAVATGRWVSAQTSNGQGEGTIFVAGTTWRKLSSREVNQRSLVSSGPLSNGLGSGSPGSNGTSSNGGGAAEVITVLSGTAPYTQLSQFASILRPVSVS